MNDEGDIFSMVSKDSHKNESLVSVLLIIVSVSFIVGMFYLLAGSNVPAGADSTLSSAYQQTDIHNIEEENIGMHVPADFYKQDNVHHTTNIFLSDNQIYLKSYKNPQEHTVVIIKAETNIKTSLLSIFKPLKADSGVDIKSSLISFSQHDPNFLEYKTIYKIDFDSIYSHERIYQFQQNNKYVLYLIAYQVPSDQFDQFVKNSTDFFEKIIVK